MVGDGGQLQGPLDKLVVTKLLADLGRRPEHTEIAVVEAGPEGGAGGDAIESVPDGRDRGWPAGTILARDSAELGEEPGHTGCPLVQVRVHGPNTVRVRQVQRSPCQSAAGRSAGRAALCASSGLTPGPMGRPPTTRVAVGRVGADAVLRERLEGGVAQGRRGR